MRTLNDAFLLNNGMKIPQLGFGCFQIEDNEIDQVIRWAADAGYRYYDAATRYENEKGVGRALRNCGVPREEIFLISKIWPSCYDEPEKAIEYSLRELNLEYIDSYFLHWPSSSEDRRYKAWETLLKYQERGLIKSVGVSNFTEEQLDKLIAKFGVTPVLNQVEIHPWYPQHELKKYCDEKNIKVIAWGPLFRGFLKEVPLMAELGEKYGKSAAQLTLRWHLQQDNIIIPKSNIKEQIEENTRIYDFNITDEDMKRIDAIESGRHFGSDPNTNDGENFTIQYNC
ncbi:MAG: aldo/keto reductase [Anaerocolumna sp.]|jgi:2,5-diketo-D-gluconate reductase A|nr:aldo/keto reductase [Anaerocolumna sp.]